MLTKLFEKYKGDGFMMYLSNHDVFRVCDMSSKRIEHLDHNGNITIFPDVEVLSSDKIEPTLHVYTTKDYKKDVDGVYGCFGLKNNEDEIVVPEQYYQIGEFTSGLWPVKYEDTDWGMIDETGKLVLDYQFWDPPMFNKYGVSYGNNYLIDITGAKLEGTKHNCIEYLDWGSRYCLITMTSEEQDRQIDECCDAERITNDIYDTKLRRVVVTGIPDGVMDVEFTNVENDVITAASTLVDSYERIKVCDNNIFICLKDDKYTVYEYDETR